MRPRAGTAAIVAALVAPAFLTAAAPPGPAQPIRFSHRVHAGDLKVGCTSCHAYAARGPVAGVPSMDRCRGCHKFVREDPARPEVTAALKPLLVLLEEGTAVRWVRVTRLPDHVYFTHERHVLAGVRCQECHGEVEGMEVVHRVAPLTMGWCLACHRAKQREKAGRERLMECVTCHK